MTARMSFTSVPRVVSTAAVPSFAAGTRTRRDRAAPVRARSFPIQPLAAALALGFAAPALHALPQGAQVVQGSAQISQQGSHLQVTNTPGAVIQWQSFGIGSGQSVHFQQQSARSAVMNRVTGGSPSEILGTLSSNGRVFLVNGAGIVFGKGAVIDTAGFTASTLNISDADWKAGKVRLQADGLPGGIAITDVVQVHGDIYLVAPQITNSGALKVQNGQAILAAGQAVSITGRGLEGVQLEVVNAGNEVLNLGSVEAGAVGMFAGTLRHSGTVHATAVETIDGRVWLKAKDAAVVSGTVTARQGNKGGDIVVSAADTRIAAGALLDASGAQGGGQVLVGGGWQGKDASIANARTTSVERGASLKADAIEVGDGGTVVVWSDGHTASHGAISARGGAQGGNGGQVETSGKTLSRSGLPDVSAPKGAAGTWLLDPDQVVIRAGFGSGGLAGDVGAGDPGPTEIYEGEIEGFGGSLTIQARKSIVGADWGTACGSNGILETPTGGAFKLETTDATCPTSPCGIDLVTNGPSEIRAATLSGSLSAPIGSLEFSAGLINGPVAGEAFKAEVKLRDVSTVGGNVTINAHGNVEIDDVNVDGDTGISAVRWNAGDVIVSSATGMLDIGSISARGSDPLTSFASGGSGGDVSLTGTQQATAPAVRIRGAVVSEGGDGSSDGNGGNAGSITITLNDAGSGEAVLQLDNPTPSFSAAAAVPTSGLGGLRSIGGDGGSTFSGTTGGNGGNITIQGGDAATAVRVDATSGAVVASAGGQAGTDASGSGSLLGTGGNAGLIQIEARDVTLDGGTYASLTRNASAGMQVHANATSGAVKLDGGATLLVAGYDAGGTTVSAGQCTDGSCQLSIQAGAGGVQQEGAGETIVTPRLNLQVAGGDVTLAGAHALGQVHGSVGGDLTLALDANPDDAQDLTLGANVSSGSTSTSLGLSVGGNLNVTTDRSAFIPVTIGAAVSAGQEARFTDLASFEIATAGSLTAGSAVSFVGQDGIRISPEDHAASSDSSNEQLTLNADELDRISTPALRIDMTQNGSVAGIFIEDNNAGSPDLVDLTGGGGIGQVALRSGGTVAQGLTAIHAGQLRLEARTIGLTNTNNEIGTVAFRALGSAGVHGTAAIASSTGMTVGAINNAIDGDLAGGQATAATAGSGSSFVDLDAGAGTFTLSEAVTGPSVRIAGANIVNGSAQGQIVATSAAAGAVTLEAANNIGSGASTADAIRVTLAASAPNDQIVAQSANGGEIALHLAGAGRTGQVGFGATPSGASLALTTDNTLTIDRSLTGFSTIALTSLGGDVSLTAGAVSASFDISIDAAGNINGTNGLTTPQLSASAVVLDASGNIAGTINAFSLSVESTSDGGSVQLTNTGSGSLFVSRGLNLGGDFSLDTAGDLEVSALSSSTGALIQAQNVTLTAQGDIRVTGAPSFSEVAFEQPAAVVPAPSGSAAIVATDTLTLNATGALVLEGDQTAAHVAGEHVNITAASLSLTGGSGEGAYAAIQYGSDITLGLPSGASLTFTPGTGEDADAVVYTTSATPNFITVDPTWNCTPDCSPDFTHSVEGPLANQQSNRGLETIAAAIPEEEDGGGTETKVDIPVIQVLVQLQRILEREHFGKVAVEAENVCR